MTVTVTLGTTETIDPKDKQKWGAKACGLVELAREGFPVPQFWVLPVQSPQWGQVIKGSEDVNDVLDSHPEWRWAVRSGAPVSMPGMMDTRLNCDRNEVWYGVHDVFESWNSDRAKAYREENDIEDTGTAVIIQRYIAPTISFVAFTSPPNGTKGKEFSPVVEWVEGSGERLVGGEIEPNHSYGGEPWYERLEELLRKAHSLWGPSDMEGVLVSGFEGRVWNLWLVQRRDIQFPSSHPEIETTTSEDHELGQLIAKGRPIGAPVTVTGKLGRGIRYKDSFTPQDYKEILKANGLVVRVGGELCHAAVVGRKQGKPAVSGVDSEKLIGWVDKDVLLDGKTGEIWELLEDSGDKSGKGNGGARFKWYLVKKIPQVDLASYYAGRGRVPVRLSWLIREFYEAQAGGNEREIRRVSMKVAEILSAYLTVVCVFESRHWKKDKEHSLRVARILGLGVPDANDYAHDTMGSTAVARPLLLKAMANVGSQQETWQELMVGLHHMFSKWNSYTFGGKKWKLILEAVAKWSFGQQSDEVFCDQVFNIRHNGNRAFDKIPTLVDDDKYVVNELLDLKRYQTRDRVEARLKEMAAHTDNWQEYREKDHVWDWFEED